MNLSNEPQPEALTLESFFAQFDFVGVIGNGCFGRIIKVQDRRSQQIYSLKKVLLDLSYHNRELAILQKMKGEACVVQLLDHLIASIKDLKAFFAAKTAALSEFERTESESLHLVSGKYEKVLYILTKCYKSDLRVHILKHGVTEEQAKLVFRCLARGLHNLHRKHICHRDLKSDNILVDFEASDVVIGDLGSAKDFSEKAGGIAYICSRPYRAPELLLGHEDYGVEIDSWSLGCVLYEVCSAKKDRLFKGKNNKEVLLEIIGLLGKPTEQDLAGMNEKRKIDVVSSTEAKSLKSLLNPLVSDDFYRIITGLLCWNPKRRLDLESIAAAN